MVFLLLLVLIALGVMTYFGLMHRGYEREAREAFEATLNPKERKRLEGFSSVRSWRDYITFHNAERDAADSAKWRANQTAKRQNESGADDHSAI